MELLQCPKCGEKFISKKMVELWCLLNCNCCTCGYHWYEKPTDSTDTIWETRELIDPIRRVQEEEE